MHRDDKRGSRALAQPDRPAADGRAARRVRRAVQARAAAGQPGAPAGRAGAAGRRHLGAPQRGRPGRQGRRPAPRARRPRPTPSRATRSSSSARAASPRSRFTPCNLVTKAQARRDRRRAAAGSARGAPGPDVHLPLAGRQALRDAGGPVRAVREAQAPAAQAPARSTSPTRTAYCGTLGQPMLYVPLSGGRVLSVAAPCQVAQRVRGQRRAAAQRLTASGGPACTRSPTPPLCCGPTAGCWSRERTGEPRVARTVVLLGLTSLFTDISSEMVVTILPLYLVYVGGFSPLAFGVIDGIYNGAAALVGLASGFIGDRLRRHKEVAAAGYGLSAICKLAAGDRRHRGVGDRRGRAHRPHRQGHPHRAARRDDLAVDARAPARHRVRRAPRAGHAGAMIGPLLAFAMLAVAPLAFDSIFLV